MISNITMNTREKHLKLTANNFILFCNILPVNILEFLSTTRLLQMSNLVQKLMEGEISKLACSQCYSLMLAPTAYLCSIPITAIYF